MIAIPSVPCSPRTTFQRQVLDRLGLDICSGRYAPGEILPPETELCQRFGFSRIVIREAVKSLAAKGIVEVRRKVGTAVREPGLWNLFDPDIIAWRCQAASEDRQMLRDLMELRRVVEPAAARLAAERATEGRRAAIRAAFEDMRRAVASECGYVAADLAFHFAVLDACDNQFFRQMQNALSAVLRAGFEVISLKPGGPAHSLPMHEDLCGAIEKGDVDAAESAALSLIGQAEHDLADIVGSEKPR